MRRNWALLTLVVFCLPAPLWAQDPLSTELHACAVIVGSVERLACYDQLARRPIPAPMTQPAPPPTPVQTPRRPASPPVSTESATADFGAEYLPQAVPAPPARSSLESITSSVTDISFDSRGHFIVALANGQVWRQIEGDAVNVPLRKELTHAATISRAILWSYSIRFDNPRGLFKVVRVR
ncbi:MAG TPA: hypothetical protein VKB67_04200 [Rhizomicrobium sp.]|nr:hypothetical protein [Rhizomicrobium sp.]